MKKKVKRVGLQIAPAGMKQTRMRRRKKNPIQQYRRIRLVCWSEIKDQEKRWRQTGLWSTIISIARHLYVIRTNYVQL